MSTRMTANEYLPDYACHPGETLADVLETLGKTSADVDGLSSTLVDGILEETAAISPETAGSIIPKFFSRFLVFCSLLHLRLNT